MNIKRGSQLEADIAKFGKKLWRAMWLLVLFLGWLALTLWVSWKIGLVFSPVALVVLVLFCVDLFLAWHYYKDMKVEVKKQAAREAEKEECDE